MASADTVVKSMASSDIVSKLDVEGTNLCITNTSLYLEEEEEVECDNRLQFRTDPEASFVGLASPVDPTCIDLAVEEGVGRSVLPQAIVELAPVVEAENVRDKLQEMGLRIKNTFLDIEEEDIGRDLRKSARTAPGAPLAALLEGSSSDSEGEEEISRETPTNSKERPIATVAENVHEKLQDMGLRIKNTFLDLEEEDDLDRDVRPCAKTAPGAPLAILAEELLSDSDAEELPKATLTLTKSGYAKRAKVGGANSSEDTESMGSTRSTSDVEDIKGSVWNLSRDSTGSWKIQQALDEAISEGERLEIAKELEGRVWEVAHDLHGNFVLQKLIMVVHPRSLQFIIDELSRYPGAVSVVARDKYGCRVLQRLLEYCSSDQMVGVVEDLLQNAVDNCKNRYSHFVIQCLLEHGTVCQHGCLVQVLVTHVHDLGADLNGSFVMAKALSTGARDAQEALANVIVSTPGLLRSMKKTQHGKYVHRLAFQVLDGFSTATAGDRARPQPQTVQVPPKKPEPPKAGHLSVHRRGGGGGAVAQLEAELRDLIASLESACRRQSPTRITKAMERVQPLLMTPGLPPSIFAEAFQACQQASQVLWSITAGGAHQCNWLIA